MNKLWQRFVKYCVQIRVRFLKFGIVGASGTVVELAIVFGLNFIFAKIATEFLARNIIQFTGYEISVATNYLLSFFWVWKDKQGPFWKGFLKYNLSTVIAFVCRIALFNLGMFLAGASGRENMVVYYILYFISIGIAMIVNFLIINHKVFTKKRINENAG